MKGKIFVIIILVLFTACEKSGDGDDTILKFFSEAYEDTGNSIAIGSDGFYICGQLTDSLMGLNPQKKVGIIKAGLDGNLIGEMKTFGDYEGSASRIIVLEDGTILCTGYVLDDNAEKDIVVLHLNPDLSVINSRIYDDNEVNPVENGNQWGVDILETTEGFLVLATTDARRETMEQYTSNPAGKKDIMLLKIDKDLEIIEPLIEVKGFNGDDEGIAVKPAIDGGYIIAGTTDRTVLPNRGTNLILLKLNANGSVTEPHIIEKEGNETASDFEVLSDGYLIAGTSGSTVADKQGYIWKMPVNIESEPLFAHPVDLDPPSSSRTPYIIKAMCRYKSSSFLLAGQYGTGLSARLLVFAVNGSGAPDNYRRKITGGMGTQIANDIITDGSENIITIGSNSYENNSMISFLKFRF